MSAHQQFLLQQLPLPQTKQHLNSLAGWVVASEERLKALIGTFTTGNYRIAQRAVA